MYKILKYNNLVIFSQVWAWTALFARGCILIKLLDFYLTDLGPHPNTAGPFLLEAAFAYMLFTFFANALCAWGVNKGSHHLLAPYLLVTTLETTAIVILMPAAVFLLVRAVNRTHVLLLAGLFICYVWKWITFKSLYDHYKKKSNVEHQDYEMRY